MPSWMTWLRSISLVSAVIGSSGAGQVGQGGPTGHSVASQIGLEHHECDLAGRGLLIIAVERHDRPPPVATRAPVRRQWRPARGRGPCCGRRRTLRHPDWRSGCPTTPGACRPRRGKPPRCGWNPSACGEVSSTVRGLPDLATDRGQFDHRHLHRRPAELAHAEPLCRPVDGVHGFQSQVAGHLTTVAWRRPSVFHRERRRSELLGSPTRMKVASGPSACAPRVQVAQQCDLRAVMDQFAMNVQAPARPSRLFRSRVRRTEPSGRVRRALRLLRPRRPAVRRAVRERRQRAQDSRKRCNRLGRRRNE